MQMYFYAIGIAIVCAVQGKMAFDEGRIIYGSFNITMCLILGVCGVYDVWQVMS